MNPKAEAALDMAAATLVLFSTMLDARVSVAVAVTFLIGLAIYKLVAGRKSKPS